MKRINNHKCLYLFLIITFQLLCVLSPSDILYGSQTVQPTTEIESNSNQFVRTSNQIRGKVESLSEQAADSIGGEWLNINIFSGITVGKLVSVVFFIFCVIFVERVTRWILQRKTGKYPVEGEAIPLSVIFYRAASKPLSLLIWVYGLHGSFVPLYSHFQDAKGQNFILSLVQKIVDISVCIAVIWFIYRLVQIIDFRLKRWTAGTESALDDMLVPLIGKTLRIFIVVVGTIFLIQNLTGIKIGPLMASLGIGGLAFALAAKDSIANFFGTLTILFDKPYRAGERIVVNNYDGVVEDVGFRSTRIRLLTGHLVSIPNEKVVNSIVENVGRRPYIRWLTNINITYDTPLDKVNKAVVIIKNILENHEGLNKNFPPRVYFNGLNDWGLNIMVIVWYHPPDYWGYQAWLDKTCTEILTEFREEGIDFAFPSRTLYIANDDKRQLKLELTGQTG